MCPRQPFVTLVPSVSTPSCVSRTLSREFSPLLPVILASQYCQCESLSSPLRQDPPQSQHRILFLTHANSAGRTSHLNADLVSPLNTTNKPFPSAAKCQTYQSHPTGGLCHQHTRKPCFHCYSFFWFTRDEMHWVNTPSGRKMDTSLYLHDLFEELPTVQCHVLIGGGQSSPQCKEA